MIDELQENHPKKPRLRRKGRKPRRVHRRGFGLWQFLSTVILMAILVLAGLAVTGRSLIAPDWVADRVEKRVNSSLVAGRITVGQILVQVSERGIPSLQLRDLGIFDERGAELIRLNDVGARISFRALFEGKIKVESILLSGAQMTLRRLADGRFDLSIGGGGGAIGTLPAMLDVLDQAFAAAPLDNVSKLVAEALTVSVQDARSGRFWQITDGSLQLSRIADGLDITVAFDVFNGTEELAEVVIGIRTDGDSQATSVGATFVNAAAADISLQTPVLSFLGVLNAPISGAIRAEFDPDGNLADLAGSLEIGSGAVQPTEDTPPVRFQSGQAYFDYDPTTEKISFTELSVKTEAASVVAQGHAYLREFKDGWPSTLVTQFSLSDILINPKGMFEQPVSLSEGRMDFRLRLNPFSIDIGQVVLIDGDNKLQASGMIAANDKGWDVSVDLGLNQIYFDRLMSFWPTALAPKTRAWLAKNVLGGALSDIRGAFRIQPDQPMRRMIAYRFADATVSYLKNLPAIKNGSGYSMIDGDKFSLVLEQGAIQAPRGGPIELAGSSMVIKGIRQKPARAILDIKGDSSVTATLSLMNEHPFKILKNTEFPVDLAQGRISFGAEVGFLLKNKVQMADVIYQVAGNLIDVSSDILVNGRHVSANRLALIANNDVVEISGPARMGLVNGDITWQQKIGKEHVGKSHLGGTVELSNNFVKEFSIGLPENSVSGRGLGQFDIQFVKDQPPSFKLKSDLDQVAISIAPIGWNKPRNGIGELIVEGRLGSHPQIDLLELKAAGLDAVGGSVKLHESGGLDRAAFTRVRAGGWLDAPVTLIGQGKNAVPKVRIASGTLDIRKTSFGGASGESGRSGGPIEMTMDRVIVSEGIEITNFAGNFDSKGGLAGQFTGRVNGKTRITGRLEPEKNGIAVRIQSDNAGGVFKSAGILQNVKGGALDLTLRPQKQGGVYRGRMSVKDTRVVNASALTEILNVISIVGLLDQLQGPGISFSDVDARFILSPKSVQLTRSSAVGPSLGVSLDGVYDLTTSRMEMQGVVSPVYFLNSIGRIFSPRRGEGLFGFHYVLSGTAENPKVQVNPLSILTPGMFREIFRRPPPKVTQ